MFATGAVSAKLVAARRRRRRHAMLLPPLTLHASAAADATFIARLPPCFHIWSSSPSFVTVIIDYATPDFPGGHHHIVGHHATIRLHTPTGIVVEYRN